MRDATPHTTHWLALNAWSVMAITGPQTASFLQGQVTCDVREMTPGVSRIGAHCDPKGRMQFSFRALSCEDEKILLRVPRAMIPVVQASLGKYILFSKAELADLSDQVVLRGLTGPDARSLLTRWLTEPAPEPGHWVSIDGAQILTLGDDRFECWLSETQAQALDASMGEPEPGDNLWTLLDIRAGLASVLPETQGQFTPQALNFTQIGAVSFRKGCYTGQEIVARLHYKGKLKQHMRRLAVTSAELNSLTPGTGIYNAADKKVGELVMTARAEQGALECLAIIDDSALEGELRIDHTFPAEPLSLPYTVE